jgi:enoyl-CoA hydratase/carnithine racemase
MASHPVALGDLVAAARAGGEPPWPAWPPSLVVAELDTPVVDAPDLPRWWPSVVVGTTDAPDDDRHPTCDVVATTAAELAAIEATVTDRPLAAVALAMLLRGAEERSPVDGLAAESAIYSTLQGGPEFAAWRAAHPSRQRDDDGERVRLERDGGSLTVTLARPQVRNALDARMRDELVEAFHLVEADPSITDVHLRGDGPAFCAGGDLDEFGSRPDPATAHLVRVLQSAGRSIGAVAERVTAHVHGPCRGSGVELPAFAGRVLSTADATFGLPEVSLGLIPGAGGTVSLPRRIGRHRTAWLALTGIAIDCDTAIGWGLVDGVDAAADQA